MKKYSIYLTAFTRAILAFLLSATVKTNAGQIVLPPEFEPYITDLCAEVLGLQVKSELEGDWAQFKKQVYSPVVFDACRLSSEKILIYIQRVKLADHVHDHSAFVESLENILKEEAVTEEIEKFTWRWLAHGYYLLDRIDDTEIAFLKFQSYLSDDEKDKYYFELLMLQSSIAIGRDDFSESERIGETILRRIEETGKFPESADIINLAIEIAPNTSVNIRPKLYNAPKPVYPWDAQDEGVSGVVIVEFDINKGGKVTHTRVVEEDPEGFEFGEAAMVAARRQVYSPHIMDGKRAPKSGLKTRYKFNIEEQRALAGDGQVREAE